MLILHYMETEKLYKINVRIGLLIFIHKDIKGTFVHYCTEGHISVKYEACTHKCSVRVRVRVRETKQGLMEPQ